VQAGAGVEIHVRPGDRVKAGQPLLTLHTDEPQRFARARGALTDGIEIGSTYDARPLIVGRVD
jgi:thymidine phosphorylase